MNSSKKFKAGYTQKIFQTKFGYEVEVGIWFPSNEKEELYEYNNYTVGKVSSSINIACKKFSLIVISSGFAGTMYDQSYLAEALARNGYIVASINHSKFDLNDGLGCERAWYRSYEIKHAIDSIMKGSLSKHIVNQNEVGLIGFSAGGFSSLILAGAQPNFKEHEEFTSFLEAIKELSFEQLYDNRIKALCLYAPALLHLLKRPVSR